MEPFRLGNIPTLQWPFLLLETSTPSHMAEQEISVLEGECLQKAKWTGCRIKHTERFNSGQQWPLIKSFNLESFYYACDSGIPQPDCEVSIAGYRRDTKVVSKHLFFPALPSGILVGSVVMNSTSFAGWDYLTHVDFSIVRADTGGDFFGALLLDNIKYRLNGLAGCTN
jgi:hypothetical protein